MTQMACRICAVRQTIDIGEFSSPQGKDHRVNSNLQQRLSIRAAILEQFVFCKGDMILPGQLFPIHDVKPELNPTQSCKV